MKTFKAADCFIQFLLLAIALPLLITDQGSAWWGGITQEVTRYYILKSLPCFFILGWQIISISIHLINPGYNKKILRRIYFFLLLAFAMRAFIPFPKDAFLNLLLMLPFPAVVLSIYYLMVSLIETKAIKKRLQPTA